MWDNIVKYLADFSNAVLTVIDVEGYPFSIRCTPEPDNSTQVLRLDVPTNSSIKNGPASLLFHKHDELLWNLKSFLICGTLERDENGLKMIPTRFIPGMGIGNFFRSTFQMIRGGRRSAKRYLEKRGLQRPKIPWKDIQDLYK